MDFLGIGPLEIFVILLVLVIVVGPANLPQVIGSLARGLRKFKQATSELSREFQQMAREAEDAGKEVGGSVGKGGGVIGDLKEVAKEFSDAGKEISAAVKADAALPEVPGEPAGEIKGAVTDAGSTVDPASPEGEVAGGAGEGEDGDH